MTVVTNTNINIYIFELRSHVIAKRSNVTDDETTQKRLLSNKYVSWELEVKFRIEQHCLMKKRCILKKHFLSIFKMPCLEKLIVFLQTADWPTVSFLWMYGYFCEIQFGQLCLGGPGYRSRTAKTCVFIVISYYLRYLPLFLSHLFWLVFPLRFF